MAPEKAEALELMIDNPNALFHLLGGTSNAYIEPVRSAILEHASRATERHEQDRALQKPFSEAERKRAYAANLTLALQDDLSAELRAIGRRKPSS